MSVNKVKGTCNRVFGLLPEVVLPTPRPVRAAAMDSHEGAARRSRQVCPSQARRPSALAVTGGRIQSDSALCTTASRPSRSSTRDWAEDARQSVVWPAKRTTPLVHVSTIVELGTGRPGVAERGRDEHRDTGGHGGTARAETRYGVVNGQMNKWHVLLSPRSRVYTTLVARTL